MLYKQLKDENFTNLPPENRDQLLYGSDLIAYDFIKNHYPVTARVVYLVPDEYYQARAQFFLFPINLKYLYSLTELSQLPPNSYDLLLIYTVTDWRSGVIQGLNRLQQAEAWSPTSIYQALKTQSLKSLPPSEVQLKNLLETNSGSLIFESKSL